MEYACGKGWRETMTTSLSDMGVVTFDPYKRMFLNDHPEDADVHSTLREQLVKGSFNAVRNYMKKVRQRDLSMVDRSDFLIAYIQPSVPTFGTMEELTVAVKARKPVLTIIEGGVEKVPFWLTAMLPRSQFFDNLNDVTCHLKCIDEGLVEPDPKYWRLLDYKYR